LSHPIEPAPEDFTPLAAEQRRQQLSRPSLSYWQDAWIRLRANRRAIISLYIVIGMLMFTLLGPLVWRVDPSAQDLDQVSRPPGAEREVTLTDPYRPWNGEAVLPAGAGLRLAYPAKTQAVRLIWDPVPGAQAYRIYRNIVPNAPGEPLGLPIAQTLTASETRYEDRLDLRAETYFYTVAALDASGADMSAPQALAVTPVAEGRRQGPLRPAPARHRLSGPGHAGQAHARRKGLPLHRDRRAALVCRIRRRLRQPGGLPGGAR
jgi:hypothetical protein